MEVYTEKKQVLALRPCITSVKREVVLTCAGLSSGDGVLRTKKSISDDDPNDAE